MREVFSKHVPADWLKKKKKDKTKLVTYWSNLYPRNYAIDMTFDYKSSQEISQQIKKIASDARDYIFNGVLKQTKDGFVYVDVSDTVFEGFKGLLGAGSETPPVDKNKENIGAHITVIKRSEIENNKIDFSQIGETVPYKIVGVKEVDDPDGWDEMESVWFLVVESPRIEEIRKSYNLSPKIKDHDFHITLAVRRRS
jgi:hypothetical protein